MARHALALHGPNTRPGGAWGRRPTLTVVVGILLVALYLATRLWVVVRFPTFLDEGILAWYSHLGLNPDMRLIALQQGFRPGLVWLTLGGMRMHFDPLVSIRLVAMTFGAVALLCGGLLAWRLVGRGAALAFALLGIFTPFLYLYDGLGLRDPVIAGLMVAAFLLQIELARKPRLSMGLLLGLTLGLAILVKDSGKAALYLLPFSLIYFPFRAPDRARQAGAWALNVMLALVICYAATLPMQLTSAYRNLSETQKIAGDTRSFSSVRAHPLRAFEESWPPVWHALAAYLTYPVIALALLGLALGARRHTRFVAIVTLWLLSQLASVIWLAGNNNARYLVPVVPFILLLAAIGIVEGIRLGRVAFGERLARDRRLAVAVATVTLLVVAAPAALFDLRVSFDQAAASYPENDRVGFITGFASGLGQPEAVTELGVLANGKRLDVLSNPGHAIETFEMLAVNHHVDINWVWTDDPEASTAALLTNGDPPPTEVGAFRRIWMYERPDHGTPIEIWVHKS